MTYSHTQRGYLHVLPGVICLLLVIFTLTGASPAPVLLLGSVVMGLLCLSFAQLTVRGEAESLLVAFGPLSTFQRRVPYADIERVEAERSDILDGFGIHWLPRRGWIWNLWGMDCVKLHLAGDRSLRVGTEDPQGLVAFLEARLAQEPA
jgi:hypothetical protein